MNGDFNRVRDLIETTDRLRRQMEPHLEERLRIAEMMRPALDHASPAITFYLQHKDHVARTLAAFRDSHIPWDEILKTRQQVEAALAPYQSLVENFRRQAMTWDEFTRPHRVAAERLGSVFSHIREASAAWEYGLAQAVAHLDELRLPVSRADLTNRLLQPYAVFTDFSDRTVQRLERSRSPRVAEALTASLTLAEGQVLATSGALVAIVGAPTDEEALLDPMTLNLLDVQQHDLLAAPEVQGHPDLDLLVSLSPATNLSERARAIVGGVVRCNEAAKVAGQPEVFKPTTRLLEACNELPWIVPVDKRTFADFVDCLYFVFYEGPGKDHLRFRAAEGGVLSDEECGFIWCIKHLRNKWSRHDADHGKDAEIRKSWKALAEDFAFLGLARYPIRAADFRRLHQGLITEGEQFMERLLDKMVGG